MTLPDGALDDMVIDPTSTVKYSEDLADIGNFPAAGQPLSNVVYISEEMKANRGLGTPTFEPNFLLARFGKDSLTQSGPYYNEVLPSVARLTFNISSGIDINYFTGLMREPRLPDLHRAITKLHLSGFHWFSGIKPSRPANPYLMICTMLKDSLEELTIDFHTAGLTCSRFSEKTRIEIEKSDPEKSKELRVQRLGEVTDFYGLTAIFGCHKLRRLHLECFDSQIVRYFTKTGDPLSPFRDLQFWLRHGFGQTGILIAIDARVYN